MTEDRVERVVANLLGEPVPIGEARSATLPPAGLYSWWSRDGALLNVPTASHSEARGFGLAYVGIGPASGTSGETLRSRLIGKHLDGNTGSSTFRLTLASHLLDVLGLRPRATVKKVVLDGDDNRALTSWMVENLRVCWTADPAPWEIEAEVVRALRPPLNIHHNRDHPYTPVNSALRVAFKARGRSVDS